MTSTMTSSRVDPAARTGPVRSVRQRILLIDDEPSISSLVASALARAGYEVDCAATGTDGLADAAAGDYDLIMLDLMFPDLDGRVVLKRLLTDRPEQEVLVLSCLADVQAKVECLELGAQDYITKPFALEELIARVRVRLRAGSRGYHEVIRNGALTLDLWRLQADSGQGPVPLTRLEFLLLRELMERAGESVPKERLLASVWGYDFDPHSNVVDVCVWRLRSKLGFELIKTVRGEGYRLAAGPPGIG
jgi:two-component system OmpR family response regulator